MASVLASDGHRSEVADAMLYEGSGQRWAITQTANGSRAAGRREGKKDKKAKRQLLTGSPLAWKAIIELGSRAVRECGLQAASAFRIW